MSETPANLKYTRTHEWVEVLDDGSIRVGITDHAQDQLGDMVYIELPESGTTVAAGEECVVIESVKAASDVYSPLSGEIVEANESLGDQPEAVNKEPYGEGWLYRLMPSDKAEMDSLLDADAYGSFVESESH